MAETTTEQSEKGSNRKAKPRVGQRTTGQRTKRPEITILENMMKTMAKKVESPDFTVSVAEYIRLLQMKRDFDDEEQPTEVKVTWVEPEEETSAIET